MSARTDSPATGRSTSRLVGIITLSVFGGFGFLLALFGLFSGPGGFLILLGVTLALLGVVGVVVGREWWALIRSRKMGAIVLAAGVLLTGIGAVITPPLPESPETGTAAVVAPATSVPFTPAVPTITPDPADALIASARPGTALTALGGLEIKDRAPTATAVTRGTTFSDATSLPH